MFHLTNKTLTFDSKPLPIKQFTVWFITPMGLIERIDDAIEKCKESDMDPELCIVPVPVAIDEAGRYEVIVRRNV